jgi:phosphatidylinositol alpha-1,6-mannosyltransferase
VKVLLLARVFPPRIGGIENYVYNLYAGLADRLDVRVLAPQYPGWRQFDAQSPLPIVRFRQPPLFGERHKVILAPMFLRACREVIEFRPQEIHCDQADSAVVALGLKRLFGIPYRVFAYSMEITERRFTAPPRAAFRSARAVLSITENTKRLVMAEFGVPAERIRVVFPAVDANRFAPRPRPQALAQRLGVDGKKVILTTGRLPASERYKGQDTVIRALPTVLKQVPDVAYVLVGDGPDRPRLEQLARDHGVADAVVFAGEVPDRELPDYYNLCDAFVMLSRDRPLRTGGSLGEGFGIVFLEAAACGKPAVGGRSGGIPEAVSDGVSGLLADPTSVPTVAQTITQLLQDPDLARRLGEQARSRVLEHFTWQRSCEGLFSALNGKRGAGQLRMERNSGNGS